MGWPVISAIRSKSLSKCSTVSLASSAVAAMMCSERRYRDLRLSLTR